MVSEAVRQPGEKTCEKDGVHSLSGLFLLLLSDVDPISPSTSIPLHEAAITCLPRPPLKRHRGCLSPEEKKQRKCEAA